MNDYVIVILALILISALLSINRSKQESRNRRFKTECLLLANESEWISMEEIASVVGTSARRARGYIIAGIARRVVLGSLENDVFVRNRYRNPDEVSLGWPEDEID